MYVGLYAVDPLLSSLWASGSVVYASVVVTVNLKILTHCHNYNPLMVALPLLSILCYFLCFYLENLPFLHIQSLAGTFRPTMGSLVTYLALLWCALQVSALDAVLQQLHNLWRFVTGQKLVEIEPIEPPVKVQHAATTASDVSRITSAADMGRHSGFAYSEENNPNP